MATPLAATQALYRFYDARGTLLYIGRTAGIGIRVARHRYQKNWWPSVVRIDIEHYRDKASVIDAERVAIRREGPLYNVVHRTTRTPAPALNARTGQPYSDRHARRLRRGK